MTETLSSLKGRYAFLSRIGAERKAARWLARDSDGARRVVAMVVPAERALLLQSALGLGHAHLAKLTDIVSAPSPSALPAGVELSAGGSVAVAEFVAGRTLAQEIEREPLPADKAVAAVLRLAEAASALHARGVVHGAISPWSLIVEPEGRTNSPVLAMLLAPPVGAYCPPERLKGTAQSPGDDVWALYAALYAALTGKPPFGANQREALIKQMLAGRPKPLAELGLQQPVLQEILSRGLIGEKRLRASEMQELTKALEGWQRDPRAMPPRRGAAPRPGAAPVAGGPLIPDPDLVVDGSTLSLDVGGGNEPAAGRALAPRSPAVAPMVSTPPPLPVTSAGPPPLPVTSAGPPPLPGSMVPPLPVTSAGPPPLPGSMMPPLPVVTSVMPALPVSASLGAAAKQPVAPIVSPSIVVAPSSVPAHGAPPTPAAAIPPPPQPEPAFAGGLTTAASVGDALGSSPNGSLSALVQELPRAAPAPKALVGSVARPTARRLSFNPFERKRKLWPIVAAAAGAGGLGVYLMLAVSGAPAATVPVATAAPAPVKARPAEKPKVSAESKRDTCVKSYFPERNFSQTQEFGFLCEDSDFREVTQRLFTTVKQQPFAATPAGERRKPDPAAQLGWYELPAAGIIRQGCCVGSAPLNLPETVGWCEQLESAVRRVADDSQKAGDLAPGARSFDKAVTCLFVHGISRPYSYDRQPSQGQRQAFQQFLSSAAISEARR